MKKLRILIARIDRIGDVVLSTPLPREIKKNYPDSFVAVLVKNYTKDIYLNNPNVDEIITYDNSDKTEKSFWGLVREIKRFKFSHAFMLLPNEKLNFILFASGVKYRVGVGHKLYQFLTFTKYVDRKKYIEQRHEADYCLDMIRKIGIETNNYTPEIFLSAAEIEEAKLFKEKNISPNQKLVGINVSSGNSAPNLSISEYRKLLLLLKEYPNYKVAVIDNIVNHEIDNLENVIYPNRNNTLRKSIVNLSAFDIVISNSTGPMHIASALNIPTISLFCPLPACSPKLWGPLGNKSEIIMPTYIYCATQCPIDPKKCDYSREGGITAREVAERIENFLAKFR